MRNRLNSAQKQHYYRELLSIGIPIIIGQLGTIVLGFADTLMIGHHSTEELAAAGLVNNIFTLVLVSYIYGLFIRTNPYYRSPVWYGKDKRDR